MKITGGAATVTNSGTIHAVLIDSGGKVTNGVSGSATGVSVSFSPATRAAAVEQFRLARRRSSFSTAAPSPMPRAGALIRDSSLQQRRRFIRAAGMITNLGTIDGSGGSISGVDIAAGGTVSMACPAPRQH